MQKLITQLNSAKKERNVVDTRQSVQRSQHSHYCKNVLPFLCSTWTKKPCKKFLINMRTGNGLLFALTNASTQVRIVNQLFEINLSRKNGRIDINVSVFDKKTFSSKPKCQFSILGGKDFHFRVPENSSEYTPTQTNPILFLESKHVAKWMGLQLENTPAFQDLNDISLALYKIRRT